jgi:hypothetical protein
MMKKKKSSIINPKGSKTSKVLQKKIEEHIPPFHEYFPITLTFKEDKEKKVCYFQCKEHIDSYIKRYKLKKSDISIKKTEPKETDI